MRRVTRSGKRSCGLFSASRGKPRARRNRRAVARGLSAWRADVARGASGRLGWAIRGFLRWGFGVDPKVCGSRVGVSLGSGKLWAAERGGGLSNIPFGDVPMTQEVL